MKKEDDNLKIIHLYPELMNIYGDMGNIITLVKRCEWRGIRTQVVGVNLGENLPTDPDIYFMGGGQDEDQLLVFNDLLSKKRVFVSQLESGVPLLAICGAFQLLGNYFLTGSCERIKGIGFLDLETRAQDAKVKSRCIGNVVAKLNSEVFQVDKMPVDTIVGFENHSGQTYLGQGLQPLGFIIRGCGNNVRNETEGCVKQHVIGTYLHGSFLPKNPHIADWLILRALQKKYGSKVRLEKLGDKEELEAHKAALEIKN